jgi:hypothetical protein
MGLFDDVPMASDGGAGASPPAAARKGLFDDVPMSKPKPMGFLESIADVFTGKSRTEYPDAPEFLQAAIAAGNMTPEDIAANREPAWTPDSVMRSAITSDQKAALDILKSQIPGLQSQTDRHGNLMLKTPMMKDWAYLNKPGISARDLDELGTQTLATLPFMGVAAPAKAGALKSAIVGGGAMAGAETARQGMEIAAGSEQGMKPVDIALNAGFGSALAPGVPTAIKDAVSSAGSALTKPVRQLTQSGAAQIAEQQVAEAMRKGMAPADVVERAYPGYAKGAAVGSAEEMQARAGILMRDPSLMGDQGLLPTQYLSRGIDVGGEGTRDLARVAANWDGASRQQMEEFVKQRYQGQGDRFADLMRELSDSSLTRGQSKEELKKASGEINRRNYFKSFDDGAHGLQSDVLDSLLDSSTVQEAVKKAIRTLSDFKVFGATRSPRLMNDRGDFSLELWDMVKRKIDEKAEDALTRVKTGRGGASEVMQYQGISRALRDELDRLVPSYAGTRSAAERVFNASDALDAGAKFASWQGRHGNEEAAKAVSQMTKNERDLFARGFLDWWQKELPEMKLNRNVAEVFNTPALQERFATALGPDKAEKFMAHMLAELSLDRARSAFGNSTTARQLAQMMGMNAGAGGIVGAGIMATQSSDPASLLTSAMLGAGAGAARRGMQATAQRQIAEQVTRLLMSNDPQVFLKGVAVLKQQPEFKKNLVKFLEATDLPQVGRSVVAREAAQEANGQ